MDALELQIVLIRMSTGRVRDLKIVPVPISIRVKDKLVYIEEDNIELHEHQIDLIKKHSRKKTEKGWLDSSRGIKIKLTPEQQSTIVDVKNQIFEYLSSTKDPKEILKQERGFGFSKHAFTRILERVERLTEDEINELQSRSFGPVIYPETLEKIVSSLISTKNVHAEAEWKGYPYLNYKFLCNLDGRELEIVVNFELGVLIITLIMKRDTGYYIREVYSMEKGIPLKKPSSY